MTQIIGSRKSGIRVIGLDELLMTPEQIREAQEQLEREGEQNPLPPAPPAGNGNAQPPKIQPENTPIVDYDLSKANPKHFAVLPARTHGTYSYPETYVCLYRLGKNAQVDEVARAFNFPVENTAKELTNDNRYIGNINWEQSMKLVLGLNGNPLTIRQGLDFLGLLVSGQAKDLEGNLLGEGECKRVLKEILAKENPWRAEWLDANFKYLDAKGKPIAQDESGTFYIDHSHKLQGRVLVPTREIMLPYLEESKWLELNSLLTDSNSQGIPNPSVTDGNEIYFYAPPKDNNSVARFYAGSGRAFLSCYWFPSCSSASLGVRFVARKK